MTSAVHSVQPPTVTSAEELLVWLDMDQAALDRAYDQSVWAPNQGLVQIRRDSASEQARQLLGEPERFAYGETPIETLEVFRCAEPNAPVAIFVHGGAWRVGRAANFAFPAETFLDAGAHYVVLDFTNVDDAGGDLMPMVAQVRRAVAWVYRNAALFGGDSERLYLFGHSSGAHIAGVTLTTDWAADHGLPNTVLKGGVVCSGMYDLEPVRRSARSKYVNFTDVMVEALSSQRRLEHVHCPITVLVGACESPEFIRQGRDFAAALKAAGKQTEFLEAAGLNHFEICETLASPYGAFGRAALACMGLARRPRRS